LLPPHSLPVAGTATASPAIPSPLKFGPSAYLIWLPKPKNMRSAAHRKSPRAGSPYQSLPPNRLGDGWSASSQRDGTRSRYARERFRAPRCRARDIPLALVRKFANMPAVFIRAHVVRKQIGGVTARLPPRIPESRSSSNRRGTIGDNIGVPRREREPITRDVNTGQQISDRLLRKVIIGGTF
jgi:hypothetical protein